MSKLSEVAAEIRYAILNGEKEIDLAKKYGVSRQAINLLKQNSIHAGIGPDASHVNRENKRASALEKLRALAAINTPVSQIPQRMGISSSGFYRLRKRFAKDLIIPGSRTRGEQRGAKINFQIAEEIRRGRERGLTVKTLAKMHGLTPSHIYGILSGRVWGSENTEE